MPESPCPFPSLLLKLWLWDVGVLSNGSHFSQVLFIHPSSSFPTHLDFSVCTTSPSFFWSTQSLLPELSVKLYTLQIQKFNFPFFFVICISTYYLFDITLSPYHSTLLNHSFLKSYIYSSCIKFVLNWPLANSQDILRASFSPWHMGPAFQFQFWFLVWFGLVCMPFSLFSDWLGFFSWSPFFQTETCDCTPQRPQPVEHVSHWPWHRYW